MLIGFIQNKSFFIVISNAVFLALTIIVGHKLFQAGLFKNHPKITDKKFLFHFSGIVGIFTLILLFGVEFDLQIDFSVLKTIGFADMSKLPDLPAFIMLVFFVPMVEELFFRGFLFASSEHHGSRIQRVFCISLIFGLAHLPFVKVALATTILSLIAFYEIVKNKTFYISILIHSLWNGLSEVSLIYQQPERTICIVLLLLIPVFYLITVAILLRLKILKPAEE